MADKSADKFTGTPRGTAYCEAPGTSCWYNSDNVCVNCGRSKGWRKTGMVIKLNQTEKRVLLRISRRDIYSVDTEADDRALRSLIDLDLVTRKSYGYLRLTDAGKELVTKVEITL